MKKTKKTTRKAGKGLSTPVQPDKILGAIVGNKAIPRTAIVKKLWVYIKAEKLQDSKDRRTINADAKLYPFFGTKKLNMMKLAGCISKHVN
ncbi:MAG: SWIB/MDM2 domain-containing protein [Pseudomonadota bacterium]